MSFLRGRQTKALLSLLFLRYLHQVQTHHPDSMLRVGHLLRLSLHQKEHSLACKGLLVEAPILRQGKQSTEYPQDITQERKFNLVYEVSLPWKMMGESVWEMEHLVWEMIK